MGFNKVMTEDPVSDPDALVPFIEGTTGSVYNIIDVSRNDNANGTPCNGKIALISYMSFFAVP